MALSMKPKVILPILGGVAATVALIIALTLSGGKKDDDFPIVTPTSTLIEATATPTPPYQASTPTATTTSATATPTQTIDDKVRETAECDGVSVVYKVNGKEQWKTPIVTKENVSDGYASDLDRFICGPDVEPIVGEDYVAAVGVDRFGFKGKITFRNKLGKEIFGYFHDGPFTDLVKIPSLSSDEPLKDYIVFLAQTHDSFYAGKAIEKTGDKNIARIPQIGVLGVDTDTEVYVLADRAVFFGLGEKNRFDPKNCIKNELQESGKLELHPCVGEASDLTFKRDGNTVNLSFELSTASGTRQVNTTLNELLESPAANRYVPLVE